MRQDGNKTVAQETESDSLKSSQGEVNGGKAARKPVAGPKVSRSNRSGLQFPVGR